MQNSLSTQIKMALILGFLSSSSFASASFSPAPNTDCYARVSQLQLVHGCVYTQGDGPGPCPSWVDRGSILYAPLVRTAFNHYRIDNPALGLSIQVEFNGRDQANFTIQAPPVVNRSERSGVTFENFDTAHRYPVSSAHAEFRDMSRQLAYNYDVRCSFGLSDGMNQMKSAEEAQTNEMGPSQEWYDASAISVRQLKVGSILEIQKELEFGPGASGEKFVEQNGRMTESEFNRLQLPYRFASAEVFNANNGYLEKTRYPKGTRFQVTQVIANAYSDGGYSYNIMFKLLSVPAGYHGQMDPIHRITAVGRRSGQGDLKIPQLQSLLSPAFSLQPRR